MKKIPHILFALIFLLFSPLALGGELLWPDKIEYINPNAPATGWLQTHENAGGHTIERHINKADNYLINRVKNGNINEASSFLSLSLAEQILALGLWQNINELAQWMNDDNAPDRLVVEVNEPTIVGKGIRRGQNKTSPRYGARIVLQKTKNKQTAYILTAYPSQRSPK